MALYIKTICFLMLFLKMPADWERASPRTGTEGRTVFKQSPQNGSAYIAAGEFRNSSLMADEESQEFDDLIFALKTGKYNISSFLNNQIWNFFFAFVFLLTVHIKAIYAFYLKNKKAN